MEVSSRAEADDLVSMARSLVRTRSDFGETADAVEALVADAMRSDTPFAVELGLERAGRRLRAGWLRSVAAESAQVLRSPIEREVKRLERTDHDTYGYERDFQPESLEGRCATFFGAPPIGWTAEHVLFSSGQASLVTILLQLAETFPSKLRTAHLGSYFETRELTTRACTVVGDQAAADCVIVEPIACDGRFSKHDLTSIGRELKPAQTLVVDETLCGPDTRLPDLLSLTEGPRGAVIRVVSGLKLLQQGLELANVGIVSVFSRTAEQAVAMAQLLRRYRTLSGTGLRFVDALALEAPFFLDPGATWAYAGRVFAHNAALACAVEAHNRLFKPAGEVSPISVSAPYCVFQLAKGNSADALESFASRLNSEAKARGLLFERGGSFGFRGHRYEVIEPMSGEPPFLRVAMGARDGRSCDGVIALIAELAAGATTGA